MTRNRPTFSQCFPIICPRFAEFGRFRFVVSCMVSIAVSLSFNQLVVAEELDAKSLVEKAVDYWRGESSYTNAQMRVNRPEWNRTLELKSWTRGREQSLVRFVAPAKEAGNATLTLAEEVWTFNPKLARIIKIPPSMKSQSWMGSDFSYQDLSKDDQILRQYDHKVIGQDVHQGKKITVVESIPHRDAPVVWGKEILRIREDFIIVGHEFYDQDGKLVKVLTTTEIAPMGGKMFPKVFRMTLQENKEHWTEITHLDVDFAQELEDSFFTTTNLKDAISKGSSH